MQLMRRGVELRTIVGDHDRSEAIVDLALLKAVARAHRWFDELSTGKAKSLAAIAALEGLKRPLHRPPDPASFPGAPDIVESVVEGRQQTTLTRRSTHPTHRASALLVRAENRLEH